MKYLKEVIPSPKKRSERWMCTSLPQAQWKDAKAELSSAEYHTNNLLVSNTSILHSQGVLTSGRRPSVEITAKPLRQHGENRVVPTPLDCT
jgi:hypothetical protein